MTVKEFKNALKGISEPIDRIAGFCDNYEQMFDHCEVRVNENTVEIDTSEDLFKPENFQPVAESIARWTIKPRLSCSHEISAGSTSCRAQLGVASACRVRSRVAC